jgi:hypothetical protein
LRGRLLPQSVQLTPQRQLSRLIAADTGGIAPLDLPAMVLGIILQNDERGILADDRVTFA